MTIERLQLLRNIGQFGSVTAGAQAPLAKLSLIYAENGRGKTTLATILRSLGTGDTALIEERRRLGSAHAPHIVLASAGAPFTYQNGAWSVLHPDIAVFDDGFVAANVCSGISIETAHKQNLHELILGARGVALNSALQGHVERIEEHNRALRLKADAIPAAARGTLTVDAFCKLAVNPVIDARIARAEQSLSAAQAAGAVRVRPVFTELSLPTFDRDGLNALLGRGLPALEADAAARVKAHLRRLGREGEAWVGEGMTQIAGASEGQPGEICPFCAQDLAASPLIRHYQAYFSDAYAELRNTINQTGKGINTTHGGDVPAAFERAVRVAAENREFWRPFTDVPDIDMDTAAIVRAWSVARDAVLTILRAKAAAPLDAVELPPDRITAIDAYDVHRVMVAELSDTLLARNLSIVVVKEQVAVADMATLSDELAKLTAVRTRHQAPTAALCDAYLAEKAAKKATEKFRDEARAALDQYRAGVFPAYEAAINEYLGRFNAGFRLGSVTSVNNRGGSSASYSVLINNVAVALSADRVPSFKNTLSAGDRNALALAFFFASLDQDARLAEKVVVIDDPMTSLDEHRRLTTVQEMRLLYGRVRQMIVLSHSKAFLCAVWEGADRTARCALQIVRSAGGSTLAPWDVRQDTLTPHDRRHELVREYLRTSDPAREREVAAALRPILEAFMRVAHPETFPPGTLLGPFIAICQQRHGGPSEIMSTAATTELRALLDYANAFHHDTNPAWETALINDQELLGFATRTIAFASR
ncbi:AAA family ATPase [Sphingomonas sp. PL-96]|uniref:AAA family ATPase n=1 Tax=Sphingomonas sp. PL-96 TaxID=2887201 RepID=UPI001E603AE3|nr:AAA family ATPase [Sphingomonas sp. PL-96]MCC2977774.1 AAA family ATPase [Sphingomonas sp. PL-96]